jgi:hypothetical protein
MVKVKLDTDEPTDGPPDETAATPQSKKTPRKSRWRLKMFLLLVLFVALLPSVLTLSGQAVPVLKKLHPGLASAVSFRGLTLHWWAPVVVHDVSVRDLSTDGAGAEGTEATPLCTVEEIHTTESLWQIAINAGRGTGISLRKPHVFLTTTNDSNNLEQTLTKIFGEADSSEVAERFPMRVIIEDGELTVRSADAQSDETASAAIAVAPADPFAPPLTADQKVVTVSRSPEVSARLTKINGTLSTMDTTRWLPAVKLSAIVTQENPTRGLTGGRKTLRSTSPRVAADLNDIVSDFPAVPLETLAGDSENPEQARIQIHLKPRADDKGRQTIQIGAKDIDLRLIQPLISLAGIDVSCEGVVTGGIDARLAGATLSDGLVGRLRIRGDSVRLRDGAWAAGEWLPLGTVDAEGAVAVAEDGMLIQDLRVDSSIVQLSGEGELRHHRIGVPLTGSQAVSVRGSVDLAKVSDSLRKTLALHSDVSIQNGRISFVFRAGGNVDSAAPDHASINAPVNAGSHSASQEDSIEYRQVTSVTRSRSLEQQDVWQVAVRLEDVSAVRSGQPLTLDSSISLEAQGDYAEGIPTFQTARLQGQFGTVNCQPANPGWRLAGQIQPQALWEQLRQVADIPQPGIRGDVQFQSVVAFLDSRICLKDIQLRSTDISVSSDALEINPTNPLTSMLDGSMHVEGSGAAIRTLLMAWYEADWLAERSHVIADLTAKPSSEIHLVLRIAPDAVANVGQPGIRSVSSTRTAASLNSGVLLIDQGELEVTLTARDNGQAFDVQKGIISVPGLSSVITGRLITAGDALDVDLLADTSYDLDVLSQRLLTPESGIALSGKGKDRFVLQGNPASIGAAIASSPNNAQKGFRGTGKLSWTSASMLGLQVGPGTLDATLENNLLRGAPIQCALNGGEINVMPQYDLASSRLQLGTGSRLTNVALTPQLCGEWMGYVAPMLADSAQVEGVASARVEKFLWDFNRPEESDVAGQLTIHQAQASPGPSLTSILEVLDLLRGSSNSPAYTERALILPEQTVPMQIRQGYVFHDGFLMELSGYRMKSSGAVGFNQQLQLTLDIPLEKSTSATAGRSIKVPLRGTIRQPIPDTAGLLQNLGTQKIQEKLGDQVDQIDQQLNKQLNKLFDKF